MSTIAPFSSPLYVRLKPVGARCNLSCEYCYYLEKQEIYPAVRQPLLSDELLEEFIRQYIEAQTMPQVLFTWHGGEPLLRPQSFYQGTAVATTICPWKADRQLPANQRHTAD